MDYTEIWTKLTGKAPSGDIRLEYNVDTYTDGCCDWCQSTVTEVKFRLTDGTITQTVTAWELGIEETYF